MPQSEIKKPSIVETWRQILATVVIPPTARPATRFDVVAVIRTPDSQP
jgi:hypothetical protein